MPQYTVVPLAKFVPATVSVNAALPAGVKAGESDWIVGTGFAAGLTITVTGSEVDPAKAPLVPPTKDAVTLSDPIGREDVVRLALPFPRGELPSTRLPAVNVTSPASEKPVPAVGVTVAVSMTGEPAVTVETEAVRLVLVGTAVTDSVRTGEVLAAKSEVPE